MKVVNPEVTIVGAGIAGCVAALGLGMAGRRVLLLERSSNIAEKGSDFLKPRGIRVLQGLGVLDELLRNGAIKRHRIRYFHDGELLFELDYREMTYVGYFLIVPYPILIRSLLTAMTKMPNVEVRFETKIGSMKLDSDQRLVLQLEDGNQIQSQIVIGADGSRSQVRQALGLRRDSCLGPHLFYAVELPSTPSVWESNRMYFSSAGLAAYFYPFRQNRARAFLIMTPQQESLLRSHAGHLAEALEVFVTESDDVLPLLPRIGSFFKYRPEIFLLDTYSRGNAVLLGSAAFSINPLTGQGMNLAIEDSDALKENLLSYFEGEVDLSHMMQTYFAARHAVHLEIIDYGRRTADFHDRSAYSTHFDPRFHGGEPGKSWKVVPTNLQTKL